ncbi:FGGY-family carbohydrate kinase [Aurantimonas sp. A2-1-M11]|uniref:FGGY-family carbohydrate kinase n=1 Tax=Aurantimonas sp. A2-1-M11 TaxID=3113712 RepID=UPI002F948FAE
MADRRDILVGIDAGTSIIKAVAFDRRGRQIAASAIPNTYLEGEDGSATQSMVRTWDDCAKALRGLGDKVENLAQRTMALSVTGQGDGTWLVGRNNVPVSDAWLWLDARAAPTVRRLAAKDENRVRFEATGTGLNVCQQGAQMAHMAEHYPELLRHAEAAFHCKDWLYLKLTDVRATDPSEACFTFGNFRTRAYDDAVIDALELSAHRRLLPEIIDGTRVTHPLSARAASETGLFAGTPVSLAFVDMAMTGLGAGVHTGDSQAAASTIGSTGVHMRAVYQDAVQLNSQGTGYVIALPLPGIVTQVQTNMAATLNIDWLLDVAGDITAEFGHRASRNDLVGRIDAWLSKSDPGAILYHPYISAGERGPFVDPDARAGFIGLSSGHRFADLMRAVVEGLAMAARDCYAAMGDMPGELRLTGGAARSKALRGIVSAAVEAPIRICSREETGAAGAAMMAAVAAGVYPTMDDCIDEWVTPLLGRSEAPDPTLVETYAALYPAYRQAREALLPVWDHMARDRRRNQRVDRAEDALNTKLTNGKQRQGE